MAALLLLVWFTLPGFFAAGPAIPGASITTMDRCSALPAAAVRKTRFQWHLSEEGQLINQLTGLCLTVGCDQAVDFNGTTVTPVFPTVFNSPCASTDSHASGGCAGLAQRFEWDLAGAGRPLLRTMAASYMPGGAACIARLGQAPPWPATSLAVVNCSQPFSTLPDTIGMWLAIERWHWDNKTGVFWHEDYGCLVAGSTGGVPPAPTSVWLNRGGGDADARQSMSGTPPPAAAAPAAATTTAGAAFPVPGVLPVESGVSVLEFGAVGDGHADDTAAFLRALNQSSEVFVPNVR